MNENLKEGFKNWGPYLSYGYDSSKEIRISWETEQMYNKTYVEWGQDKEHLEKEEISWMDSSNHHCVILSDLKPKTEYYYKIYTGDPIRGLGDPRENMIYKFKTGPQLVDGDGADSKDIEFEFTMVGDMHANYCSNVSASFAAMDRNAPDRDFVITLGDCIDNGNKKSDWQSFFRDINPWLPTIPVMNTTGNHDTGNPAKYARFIRTWDHPYVDKRKGGYYSFRYGNAAFIIIDSNNGGTWQPTPLDDQYDWIESELEKYYEQNLWIFVTLHHQIYSTGDFSMSHIANEVYRPLFDEYHVDAVFYGHDHHYEAFWTNKDSEWGGTKYFVSGAGGGQNRVDYSIMGDRDGKTKYVWLGRTYIYKRDGIIPPTPNITKHAMGFRNDEIVKNSQLYGVLEPHFVDVKIRGNECQLRAIGYQNQVFHELKFKKTLKR
ncbi:MAG: metallophosphoesterase [Promethearchaeota archaeon]